MKAFPVSLCREGILGGGLYVGEDRVTYRTGKVTVSPSLRKLELHADDISSVKTGHSFAFPAVTFCMKNGENFKFLVFTPKALMKALEGAGLNAKIEKE